MVFSEVSTRSFPNQWRETKLEEISELITKGTTPTTYGYHYVDEGVNFIKVECINENGKINPTLFAKITEEAHFKLSRSQLKEGDILISIAGALGRVAIVGKDILPANTNQALAIIRLADASVKKEYLFYSLKGVAVTKYINEVATSGAQPNLSLKQISQLTVGLPPLPEQRKIADILTSVDNAISKTEAIIEQTEKVKKGLMQQLLTKGIGHTKLKQTEIGEIPEGWGIKSLDELTSIITNGFVGVASPYYCEEENAIPYLMSNNIRANMVDTRKLTKVVSAFNEKYQKSILQKNDMLTVQSGHIGTTCVVPTEFEGGNCHALIISRFSDKNINPYFVALYLNSSVGMARLKSIFVGSTVKHINVKDFKKFTIPVPSYEEQSRIVRVVQSIGKKLEVEEQKLDKLQFLKKGLMQVLLTGKVRVKVDEQEAVNT